MKILTYIIITLTLLAFSIELYGDREKKRYSAIIDENDQSVQRLIHGEEQRSSQERKQSSEKNEEKDEMERTPASKEQDLMKEEGEDEYRINEYMERHARPPLYDRRYK